MNLGRNRDAHSSDSEVRLAGRPPQMARSLEARAMGHCRRKTRVTSTAAHRIRPSAFAIMCSWAPVRRSLNLLCARSGHPDLPDHRDLKVTQDRWDLKDHKALGAHKELPVPPDRRGRLAQGLPGLTGPQGPAGIGLTDGAVLFLKPGSVPRLDS